MKQTSKMPTIIPSMTKSSIILAVYAENNFNIKPSNDYNIIPVS
jgi:hypothetical protein